jgi:hypothetical protein
VARPLPKHNDCRVEAGFRNRILLFEAQPLASGMVALKQYSAQNSLITIQEDVLKALATVHQLTRLEGNCSQAGHQY